jgi:hypothetical protein
MVIHTCNLSTLEAEEREWGVRNQFELYREFQASSGYITRLCLKNQKPKNQKTLKQIINK